MAIPDQEGRPSDRSTGDLIRELASDLQLLVRKELELARTQLMEALNAKLKGAGLMAFALLLVFPALLFFFVALAVWLPQVTPLGRAGGFTVVGLLMLLVCALAVAVGLRLIRRKPDVTAVDSIKEDVRWARDRLKS